MKISLQQPHVKAILFATLGYFLWSITDVAMKLIRESDIPVVELIALNSLIGGALVVGNAARRGKIRHLWPKQPFPVIATCLMSVGTNVCNLLALPRITLPTFYIIVFVSPLMVCLLAALVLREALSLAKGLIILSGFVGVLIAVNPQSLLSGGNDALGVFFAFLGTLFFAVEQIAWRRLCHKERKTSLLFVNAAVNLPFGLIGCLFVPTAPVDAVSWFYLFIMGGFGVLGSLAIIRALSYAPASTQAGLHYSQLIPGLAFGYLIWGTLPSLPELLGAALIVLSGLALLKYSEKTPLAA